MPLNIKSDEAHFYARKLAELTGKTLTEVVTEALKAELEKEERKKNSKVLRLIDDLDAIALRCASFPVLDNRSSDEILGYDEKGLPG